MSTRNADDAIALAVIYFCMKRKKTKRKIKKRVLMKECTRNERSHVQLLKTLKEEDYRNFLRMDADKYMELLNAVTPMIRKEDTVMREAIPPNERLSATLRFLASGQSFEDLKFLTNMSAQSLGRIIIPTCKAIISSLDKYIQMPKTPEEWRVIATEFEKKWNFNHCIGAIDGKHIHIKKPAKSGSYYYNYKKTFSIVLMAVVNANYEFISVEVGTSRVSDGGVLGQSNWKKMYEDGRLNLPPPKKFPLTDQTFPYVLVGDDAFPLLENLMKPYSRRNLTTEEQIFNDRLSRARRIVENTFGILANRFRVLHSTINLCPEKASLIITACCYLHNFLRIRNPSTNLTNFNESVSENRDAHLVELEPMKYANASVRAKNVRNQFCNYFNTVGAIPWQNNLP